MFSDKSIALLVWNKDDERDVHVYKGKIIQSGSGYSFVNESEKWNVTLSEDQLDRLQEVKCRLATLRLNIRKKS